MKNRIRYLVNTFGYNYDEAEYLAKCEGYKEKKE